MEMDILVKEWSIISRQGLFSLMPRYKDTDAQVGFVLQGADDDELPERMLGGVRIPYVDPLGVFPEFEEIKRMWAAERDQPATTPSE